ncbi:MAG: UPF0147 family protein [Candidatus Asgardarchaeia archaeon]
MSLDEKEALEQAMNILNMIVEDTSIPRNIRRAANEALEYLKNESLEIALRSNNAISVLDQAAIEPTCPMHARTKIYRVISLLEPLNR